MSPRLIEFMGLLQTRRSESAHLRTTLTAVGKPDESGCGFRDHRGVLVRPTLNGAVIRWIAAGVFADDAGSRQVPGVVPITVAGQQIEKLPNLLGFLRRQSHRRQDGPKRALPGRFGAEGGTRTPTVLLPPAPQTG